MRSLEVGVPTYLFQDFTRKGRGYLPISNLFECKSESAEFNLRLRYDMRISVIIFSPTENGPRRLRLTLVCSFSIIILDSDSITTLGRE